MSGTIRRQGPSYQSHWADHCDAWYAAVAGVAAKYTVAPDGFTSATATSYAAPNNPISQTWDCTNASGAPIPDGNYKLWIQYAGDDSQPGPVTTNGLLWTKGPSASTANPPDQGGAFTNMSIIWTPGTPVTGPEIAVQQPAGSNLADGSTKISFGTGKIGKKGMTKTFTIQNTGTGDLTGLAVKINGGNASDFIVTPLAKTTLIAGSSTTFKVSFKPSGKGLRQAAIHIKSNDADENPFDIKLTGQGGKKIKKPSGGGGGDDDDNDHDKDDDHDNDDD